MRKRWPLTIHQDELLGRTLFSGNYKKGKIDYRAFKLRDPSKGMSVSRLTYAPRGQIDLLSNIDAQHRTDVAREKGNKTGEIKFYGYASITAEEIRSIKVGVKSLALKATLTAENPFHGDITLPVDEEEDFYLEISDALLQKAKFIACQ